MPVFPAPRLQLALAAPSAEEFWFGVVATVMLLVVVAVVAAVLVFGAKAARHGRKGTGPAPGRGGGRSPGDP